MTLSGQSAESEYCPCWYEVERRHMVKTNMLSPFTLFVLMVVLALSGTIFLAGVADIGKETVTVRVGQHDAVAIEWTGLGERTTVPPGMTVREHANKHRSQVLDAWKIYTYLLEGQCVATAVFCGPSDIEKLYLCVDPTGRIGGLVVFGEEILTGYQGSQDYWTKKVNKPHWEVCHD